MRKRLFATVACAAVLAFTGCDKHSTPGGPGATSSSKGPNLTQKDETFDLKPPTFSKSLKQGEARDVTIGISRGKNLDTDVAISFEGLPKGVTIEPANPVLKHSEKEVKITVKAANDAAVGKHTIKIKGKPEKGNEAASEMTISVDQK